MPLKAPAPLVPAHEYVYSKTLVAVRYRLLGRADVDRNWMKAVEALEFSLPYHTGTRKDLITPTFQHQLEIALYVMGLPNLIYPVETVGCAFTHDLYEDTNALVSEVEGNFGELMARGTWLLTKESDGKKKPLDLYFSEIATCPIASIDKGGDRVNNHGSMENPRPDGSPAIRPEKQLEQVDETERYVLPMLKAARRRFPKQEQAYEAIKFILCRDIPAVRARYGHLRAAQAEDRQPSAPGMR